MIRKLVVFEVKLQEARKVIKFLPSLLILNINIWNTIAQDSIEFG